MFNISEGCIFGWRLGSSLLREISQTGVRVFAWSKRELETAIRAFVTSRLDFCSCRTSIGRLQRVQNATARFFFNWH